MSVTHLGRYEIIGELGRGAMGRVFKARDPLIERIVASKTAVCDGRSRVEGETSEQRFFREAKSAGQLSHPNIVTIYDVGRDGDLAYIVMEFLEGRSLREVLDSGVALGADRIADIAAQVADGLAFAHANDLVHCDVKPANLMLLENGGVKIADFGVAVLPPRVVPVDGTAIGSPKYMSPEQVTGQALDGRSDIFALGAVLYEMLTGLPPFSGDDLGAILQQVVNADPVAPSSRRCNLHAGLDAIVARAMAKDPDERYRTATEMALDLRRYRELAPEPSNGNGNEALAGELPAVAETGNGAVRRRARGTSLATGAVVTVLLAIVAVRFMQPKTIEASAAADRSATLTLAAPSVGRKAERGKPQAAPTHAAVDTVKAGLARKADVRRSHQVAKRVDETIQDQTVRRATEAQHPTIAPSASPKPVTPQIAAGSAPGKAPSPEHLCADRANFISRGFCENRVCLEKEWIDHPFCVRKREQDMRSNPIFSSSG
jgi:hypothetical protein